MFCTDDKSAEDIKENGCIDNALRIAVKCGISPVSAIKMATLNAARHYGVDDIIGSVAPSRKANFLLMDSLENMTVKRSITRAGLWLKTASFFAGMSLT